jgi:hypothetical protein
MFFSLKALLFFLALTSCFSQQPADKGANAKTKKILEYVAGLPKQSKMIFNHFYVLIEINRKISIRSIWWI